MKAIIGVSASLLLLTLFSSGLFSQTETDKSQIWQECVNLYELQDHVIAFHANSDSPVYVVPGAVDFPGASGLISFGRRVEKIAAADIIEKEIEAYFRFDQLEILGNSATADFSFFSNNDSNTGSFTVLKAHAVLQKSPNGWSIKEKIIEEI